MGTKTAKKQYSKLLLALSLGMIFVTVYPQSIEVDSNHTSTISLDSIQTSNDTSNTSSILYAIESHDLTLFKELLKTCGDVNADVQNIRLLLAAIYQKNEEMVRLLLEAGATLPTKVIDHSHPIMPIKKFLQRYATSSILALLIKYGMLKEVGANLKLRQKVAVQSPKIPNLLAAFGCIGIAMGIALIMYKNKK